MKITTKILNKRTNGNTEKCLFLDLSGLGIGAVENLEVCSKLQQIDLSNNCLEEFEQFESCHNLWRINLANNHICNLKSLSKLYAVGSLDLSNNSLSWKHLAPIRNTHILDIRLHGNFELEKDPHYRIHVVDCLPRVWVLDGRIVTATERIQVQHFFHDSALSVKPVRHKLNENKYYRVSQRCAVIHGERANQLAAIFPANEIQNQDTDRRRLEFLAESLQRDIKVELQCRNNYDVILQEQCLTKLVLNRHKDKERSNMLLLLLIASLEFNLPEVLVEDTLEVARLDFIFGVETLNLFRLSAHNIADVISLLVSACKLDRDLERPPLVSNFTSGGLYDRLYLCLYHSVSHLKTKRINNKDRSKQNIRRPQTAPARYSRPALKPSSSEWRTHLSLLCSEVALLLSVVPSFYRFILDRDPAVSRLLLRATGDSQLPLRLASISNNLSMHGGNTDALHREIHQSVARKIERASDNISTNHKEDDPYFNPGVITPNTKEARFILNTGGSYPRRPKSAVLSSGEHLTSGKIRKMPPNFSPKPREIPLTLGSNIALGAQNLARVIALPEKNVALVQMASVPAANGSVVVQPSNMEEHYQYVDTTLLEFDLETAFWKPKGATGDLVTLQRVESLIDTPGGETTLLSPTPTPRKSAPKPQGIPLAPKPSQVSPLTPRAPPLEFAPLPQPQRPLSAMFCEKMDLSLSRFASEVYPQSGTFFEDKRESYRSGSKRKKSPSRARADNPDCRDNNAPIVHIGPIKSPVFLTQPLVQIPTTTGAAEQIYDHTGARELDDVITTRDAREQNKEDVDSDLPQTDDETSSAGEENFSRRGEEGNVREGGEEANVREGGEEANVREGGEEGNMREGGEEGNVREGGEEGNVREGGEEGYMRENKMREEENGSPIGRPSALVTMETGNSVANDDQLSDYEEEVKYLEKPKTPSKKASKHDEGVKRRVKSARVPTTPLLKESERPQSAVVPRHVLFHDESDDESRHGSVSSFQLRRTEAWRSSASSGSGFGVHGEKFRGLEEFVTPRDTQGIPPQRPTSPSHEVATSSITVATSEDKPMKPLSIQIKPATRRKAVPRTTSSWLAEGRNLHQEVHDRNRLITSPRLPGYLEGTNMLPSNKARAKSAKSGNSTPAKSEVAKHVLPSRTIKPFSRLPCYRRSNSPSNDSAPLGGALAWRRPQFSPFDEVKKLKSSPAAVYRQRKKFPSLKYLA